MLEFKKKKDILEAHDNSEMKEIIPICKQNEESHDNFHSKDNSSEESDEKNEINYLPEFLLNKLELKTKKKLIDSIEDNDYFNQSFEEEQENKKLSEKSDSDEVIEYPTNLDFTNKEKEIEEELNTKIFQEENCPLNKKESNASQVCQHKKDSDSYDQNIYNHFDKIIISNSSNLPKSNHLNFDLLNDSLKQNLNSISYGHCNMNNKQPLNSRKSSFQPYNSQRNIPISNINIINNLSNNNNTIINNQIKINSLGALNQIVNLSGTNNINAINNLNCINGINLNSMNSMHSMNSMTGINNSFNNNLSEFISLNKNINHFKPIPEMKNSFCNTNLNLLNKKAKSFSINNIMKNNKNEGLLNEETLEPFLSIKNIINTPDNSLYNFIITQKGSRYIQNTLKRISASDVTILINKLSPFFSCIMTNKYGNYFSQKLIQISSAKQRMKIIQSISNNFIEISNNSFGTHAAQILVEIINLPEEKALILSSILGKECELALDSKGTHVLQKFISGTKDEERVQLTENILKNMRKLITNPFGVCVLIKLVKHSKDKNISKIIANYITENNCLNFIQHPYSNYVVQSLFNPVDMSYCTEIVQTIVENYVSLSLQKYSSNVVENCIKYGDEQSVKKIFKNIIKENKLDTLLNNCYGNFVLEKLIRRLNKDEKIILLKSIQKIGKIDSLPNNLINLLLK